MQPNNGPERGRALRRLIRTHDLTVGAFAERAGVDKQTVTQLINGDPDSISASGRRTGRDLARVTPETAKKLSDVIATLEPTWDDTDLWSALGVPPERRGDWSLGRPAGAAPEAWEWHSFSGGVWGKMDIPMPVRLTVLPTGPGLRVWKTGTSAALLPEDEELPRGELLGYLDELRIDS